MSVWFKYFNRSLYKRLFCSFEMPLAVLVSHADKKAMILDNWEIAQNMANTMPDTYYIKYNTLSEAEKHIRDVKCLLVRPPGGYEHVRDPAAEELERKKNLKRKRELEYEEQMKKVKSVTKDQIKKIKMIFNGIQIAIANLPLLSPTCAEQIQTLNDKVAYKLSDIFKVKKTISQEDVLDNAASNTKQEVKNQQPSNQSSTEASSSKSLPSTSQTPKLVPTRPLPLPSSSSSSSSSVPSLTPSPLLTKANISKLPLIELKSARLKFSQNLQCEVIVYTDGSCLNNGTSKASAGAGVWFGNNHPLNASLKVPGAQTNNNAEIYAIIKAIERVRATGWYKINVRSDSDFTIKSIKDWMPKWLNNGWKTAVGGDVKNKQMFIELQECLKGMDKVTMTYVPAHKGITGNEEADKLAKLAAKN